MKLSLKMAYGNTIINELMHRAGMWEHGKWSYKATVDMDCEIKDTVNPNTLCERIGCGTSNKIQPLAVWCPDNPEIKPWIKHGVQTISDGERFMTFSDFLRIACDLDPITDENMFVTGLK